MRTPPDSGWIPRLHKTLRSRMCRCRFVRRCAYEPSDASHLTSQTRGVQIFGLDDRIAHLNGGGTLLVIIGVAVLLGLRHATDPDHLTAVSTLVAR